MDSYHFHGSRQKPWKLSAAILSVWLFFWTTGLALGGEAYAQASPPITTSGLNTQISTAINVPGGKVQYDITGGTRPVNGPNLFHSFGEFGVPNNNIANFLNDSGRATSNILSRVTGGNPSNIFGTLQTTGFGNANLFLMNPSGIVFGPNATLNVGGSVHFTTADYLRLTDGARFTAVSGSQDALLSTAPVAAFGFLASSPAAISIQGSALSILAGESMSLVGGDISIQGGTLDDGTSRAAHLSALSGQIRLSSVASPGEVLHPTLETSSNMDGHTFSSMGMITLSGNATLDVSADAAGTVIIRGGQLVFADATISANTGAIDGTSPAVDINVTGDVSMSDTRGAPAISATTGAGDAGDVLITSTNLNATSSARSLFALINTHTSGSGKGGNVGITTTSNLNVTGNSFGQMFFIDSGTVGLDGGHGGGVTISAANVELVNTNINTGDFIARQTRQDSAGSGGDVTMIIIDTLQMTRAVIATDGFFNGRAGDLTISARDIQMNAFSQLTLLEFGGGGALKINADRLIADSTQFELETVSGPGGGVAITANIVEFKNGTTIRSQTVGDGDAGDIRIVATDHLQLSDDPNTLGALLRPTGLFTNSLGDADLGNLGNAGAIIISTPQMTVAGGARIDTTTQTNGRGGDVTITATNGISIAGERPTTIIETELFGLGSSRPSGIFTRTVDNDLCTGPCGDAGRVSITTGSLNLSAGAAINSGTTSTGSGGDISINATGPISISGTLSDGTPGGIFSRTFDPATGAGGKIDLRANQVSLDSGAAISAQSTSIGEGGNISIEAVDSFISQNGSITTSTTQSDGGNISINAGNLVQLVDSQITTNVQGGFGDSGNISIDPPTVIIERSNIIASAIGGNGGNINIVAGVLLVSPESIIDASSTFGLSGTITIESPITNLSGTLAPLPQGFVQPAAFAGRCAARIQGGPNSSLVVRTSRDRVPAEPGELLLSPLFASTQGASVAQRSNDINALRAGLTVFPVPAGCPS